jgi:uracil-DNA glycosylase
VRIAFDGYLDLLTASGRLSGSRRSSFHGAVYKFDPPLPTLVASYHPSRQNTQTGRLTPVMLDQVFEKIRKLLDG